MDFNDTKEEAKFRKKCRDWLEKNATYKEDSTPQNDDFANKDKMKAAKAWQKKKYDAGWAMLRWPKEYGGTGWDDMQRYIFSSECASAGAPSPTAMGLHMVGPVLMKYGNLQNNFRRDLTVLIRDGTPMIPMVIFSLSSIDLLTRCGLHLKIV